MSALIPKQAQMLTLICSFHSGVTETEIEKAIEDEIAL